MITLESIRYIKIIESGTQTNGFQRDEILIRRGYCMQGSKVRMCPNSGHFTYHARVFYQAPQMDVRKLNQLTTERGNPWPEGGGARVT